MHKQLLLFIAALTFSATARAEASLADLIFMMPKLVLMGIYNELARPWLLAGLWGAAILFWLVRAIVLRNRASARLNSTPPIPSSHTSDGHTTAQPAPR